MYINSFLRLIMTGTGFIFKLSLKCIFLLKFDDRCSKRCSKIFERNVWFTNLSKHFLIQYFFFFFQLVQLVYFSSISIVCISGYGPFYFSSMKRQLFKNNDRPLNKNCKVQVVDV